MIVIELFIALSTFLSPILILLSYVFCLPQLILKHIKVTIIQKFDFRNGIQLTLHFAFYLIYIAIYLNLHFIYIFKYYLGVDSILQLFLSYLLMNTLTAIMYKVTDMNFYIFDDLPHFLFLSTYEFLFILIILCFIFSFGDRDFIDFILFRRVFRSQLNDFFALLSFGFFGIWLTLGTIVSNVLFLLHCVNPISFIRAIYIMKHEYRWNLFKIIFVSCVYIIQDFLLLLAVVVNVLFVRTFVKNVKKLCFDYYRVNYHKIEESKQVEFCNEDGDLRESYKVELSDFERDISYAEFYIYLKHVFILKTFKKNIKFSFAVISCVLMCVLFWKIPKVVRIFSNFLQRENLKELSLDIAILIVDGLLEILTPFIFLYNHFNPLNCTSLYKIRRYYQNYYKKDENRTELSFTFLNFIVFINKAFDLAVTILSLTRILNFTFIVYLIHKIKENKFSEVKFFPLLSESEHFIEFGKEDADKKIKLYPINNCIQAYITYLFNRRVILLAMTFKSNLDNLLLVITLPAIIDPFYGLRYIRNIYFFIHDSLKFQTIKKANSDLYVTYNEFSFYFTHKMIKNIFYFLGNIIFYIPINLFMAATAPWCLIEFVIFSFKLAIRTVIEKMRMHTNIKYEMKFTMGLFNKIKKHSKKSFEKWVEGWVFIFKFVTMHVTLVRAILLWREFFFLKNYRQQKIENLGNTLIKKTSFENDANANVEENVGLINNSNVTAPNFGFKRQLSQNTEIFLRKNNNSLFKFVLDKNFRHFLREFIFYPFIIFYAIVTPWSILRFKKFVTFRQFDEKLREFMFILLKFFSDLITIITTTFVLLSLINSIKALTLIYYAAKKNILHLLGDQNASEQYDILYKNDFQTEMINLSSGLFRILLIFILIILNICFITRIFSVFRRIRRFIVAQLSRDISKLKHLFDTKIQTEPHKFIKLSSTVIVTIFEFLPPNSIYNIQLVNKSLYQKSNLNLVWRNLFENYYLKKLRESSTPEVYNLIKEKNYTNHKEACVEANSYLNKKVELTEAQRDSLIGALNVMIEETIESLLKIPHLLLIPVKIISAAILYIRRFCIDIQIKFSETRFFQDYLTSFYFSIPTGTLNLLNNFDENLLKDFTEAFYNIQLVGIKDFIEIIGIFVLNVFCFFYSIFIITLKLITFTKIKITEPLTPHEKIERINNKVLVLYQYIISSLFVICHIAILFYPTYYFHQEGFNNLFTKHFSDANYSNYMNYYNFIEEGFAVWWNKGFFGRIFFIFLGTYGSNLIIVLINQAFCYILKMQLSHSHVFIYNIVCYFVVIKNGLIGQCINNIPLIFNVGIFPQVYIIFAIWKFVKTHQLDNVVVMAALNFTILVVVIYPFYWNFKIGFTFFRFVCLNVYAITSMIKMVKIIQ